MARLKLMKAALAAALLAFAATPLRAQSGSLAGVVQDTLGEPLRQADVVLQPLGRSTLTGAAGEFAWRDLPAGVYRVVVSLIGYRPAEERVQVAAGAPTRLVVRLSRTPLTLHGIEVSASPLSGSTTGVRQATAQLSGKALERELGGTIAQTLRFQPGVAVRSNGPAASLPVLRGLTGDRILLLQDGQRTADLAGSASDHASTVDALAAQRVEVVRGPATLLYGNNALGGVVNVISGDVAAGAPTRPELSATLQSESVQPGAAVSARLSVPVGSRWAVVGRAGGRSVADMRIPRDSLLGTRLENTDARTWNASLGLTRASAGWTGSLAGRAYGFGYGLPVPPGAGPVRLAGDRQELVLRADAELAAGAIHSARIDGTLQEYGHDELDENDVVQQRFQLSTRTVNLNLKQGRVGPLREGAWGASLLTRRYAATGPAALTPAADVLAYGMFGFQEVGLPARLPAVQLGGRFDEYRIESRASAKFGAGVPRRFLAWSGSAGVRQPLGRGLDLSLTVARSFRAPTVEELFSGAPHAGTGSVEYGSPTLRAERGRSLELLLHGRGERLSGQASAYRNRIDDFIQLRFERDTTIGGATLPVYRYTQTPATMTGAEGAVQVAASSALVLGVQGDILHAEDAQGQGLSYMPPARLGGHVRWDNGRFSLGGELHHEFAQNRTGAADEPPTPAHSLFRVDAGIRLRHGTRTHSVSIRGENLGNELHREATSRTKDFAPGPGRNVALVYRVYF